MPEKRVTEETWYRDIKGEWYKITGIKHCIELSCFRRDKLTKVHFVREDLIVSYFTYTGHLTKAEVEKKCLETENGYLKSQPENPYQWSEVGYTFSSITDTDRLDFMLKNVGNISFRNYDNPEYWQLVIEPKKGKFLGMSKRECIDAVLRGEIHRPAR